MRHPLSAPILASLLALPSCSSIFAAKNAHISCASDADCPKGYQCRAAIGLCIDSNTQVTIPSVAQVVNLSGRLVSAGGEISVELIVSEPLDADPIVRLATPEQAKFDKRSSDGTHYVYAYTVDAGLTPGAWDILASLVNQSGVSATDIVVGTVVLDFAAPSIVAASIDYLPHGELALSALRDGMTLAVTLNTSEALASDVPPRLVGHCVNGDLTFVASGAASGPTLFSQSLTLDASQSAGDGECTLAATLCDLAGNEATTQLAQTFVVDRTAPDGSAIHLDKLRHLRVPWGAQVSGGVPRQYLVGVPAGGVTVDPAADLDAGAFALAGEPLLEGRVYGDAQGTILLGLSHPLVGLVGGATQRGRRLRRWCPRARRS